jgi:hypothetical protein
VQEWQRSFNASGKSLSSLTSARRRRGAFLRIA